MKHIFTMNQRNIVTSILLLLLGFVVVLPSYAGDYERNFDGTEVLYIKTAPANWYWYGNDMDKGKFAYFFNSNTGANAWTTEAVGSPLYDALQIVVPAGNWTHVILTRHDVKSNPSWDNIIWSEDAQQKSGDIPINSTHNYLQNFARGTADHHYWAQYIFGPSATNPAAGKVDGIEEELIEFCPESSGDPFSLTPIFDEGGKDYNYNSSGSHAWYKWNGSSWELVSDQYAGYKTDGENEWFCNEKLSSAADTYYFLWTNAPSRRRLLHLKKKASCPEVCEITSFRYVTTPVNVNDSTFAFEGSVAFTKKAGDLIIQYRDSILTIEDPVSPQVFSLQGLKADGAEGHHLTARFSEDGSCEADSVIKKAPSPESGVTIYLSNIDYSPKHPYSPKAETYSHNTSVLLTPSVQVTDSFVWTDIKGNKLKSNRDLAPNNTYTISGYNQDTTILLYYTEFNTPPVVGGNMMSNGSYEDLAANMDGMSDYDYTKRYENKTNIIWDGLKDDENGGIIDDVRKNVYWFKTGYDAVKDTSYYNAKSGIWGITTDANIFWERMAKISPKDANYMAVFDGDAGEKEAWKAVGNPSLSPNPNPNLLLQKGTTYMFSFWVANVNNFGEMINFKPDGSSMTNNAILQFKIKYKDKATGTEYEEFLGEPTNLNDSKYLNNFWHQNSATFTSPVDADEVTVSVVDKNTSGMRIGNDFALDDIQFRPVSIKLATVRARERFEVKFVEPGTNPVNLQVEWVTRPACGQDTCTMRVSFRYPNITTHDIKLTLKDLNTSNSYGTLLENVTLAKTPIPGNADSTDYVGYFTSGSYGGATYKDKVKADAATHNIRAKLTVLDANDVDHGGQTNESGLQAPGIPALAITDVTMNKPDCSGLKYTLDIDLNYTALSGTTLTYYVDNVSKATRTIDYEVTARTKNDVPTAALDADGKEHTLKVSTGHALDCIDTYTYTAPKANIVSDLSVAPIQPDCDEEKYRLIVSWEVTKPAVTGSLFDTLMIKVGDASPYEILIKAGEPNMTISGNVATGTFEIPIDYAIGASHPTIKAYMKERGASCYFTPLPTYADPTVPRMTIGTPTFEDIACNVPTFTLVVPDTFIYQRGDMRMWLDSATYDKAKSGQKITITDGNRCAGVTTGDKYTVNSTDKLVTLFKFTGLSLTGTHKIFAECTGEHSCHRVPEDYAGKEFVAPTLPTAAVKEGSIEYTSPVCDVETVTLKFTINYVNQSGTLKVWVTDLGEETYSYAGTTGSVNIEYPNVPADGWATRKLNFEFEGSCSVTNIALPAPPRWPVVKGVTVTTPANVACSEDDYTASIKVDYVNIASADKLVVQYTNAAGETKTKKMDEVSLTGTSKTFDFTLDDIDKGSKELYVYLDGAAADCKTTLQHKGTYTAPYRPELIINSVDTLHDACSASTYAIAIDWKYRAFKAGTMKFYVDETEKGTPRAVTYNATTFTLCKDTIKGLTADGGLHTLKLLTNVADNCTESRSNIRAPKGNTITSFRVDTTVLKCDETKYKLIASWEVSAPAGTYDTLIIVNAANEVLWKDSLTSATRSNIVTLAKEYTVGDVTTPTPIYAYLKERGRSACDKSDTYVSPVTPKLNALSTRIITDSADCDESTYSLIVPITYTNQHGRMYVWLDAASYAVATDKVEVTSSTGFVTGGAYADGVGYTEGAAVSKKTYAKITGIQGNGAERKVSVAFDDPRGCKILDGLTYTEPFRPVITGVTATPTTPDAGVLTYDVEVTVSTTNGHGRQVTITSGDLGLPDFTGNVDGITGKLTHTFEGIVTDHGKTHKFYAYFTDRKNCVKEGSFTSPDQRKFHTFNVVDTLLPLCDNTSYVVFEVTSTAMGGELVIKDKDTDVELYRHATPITNPFRDTIKHLSRQADGSVHTLVASFTAPTPVQSKEDSYTARPEPTISMSGGAVTGPDCKGTVHLPLTVSFVNQTSDLYIVNNKGEEIDHVLAAELIGKSTFSAGEYHYTKDWTYEANDESATLRAYAYFADRPDCTRPEVSAVEKHAQTWGYTYHHSAIACDGSYTSTLHFTWSNGASAFHIDSVDATSHVVQASLVNDSHTAGSVTRIIKGNVVTDTPKDIYRVYWDANNTDECDSIITTIVPDASVWTLAPFNVTKNEVSCGATKYTFHPTWTYLKAASDLIIAEVGVDEPVWKGAANTDPSTVVITGDLDLANPGKPHKFYAYFEDRGAGVCNSNIVSVNEPLVPYVKVTRSEYTQPACDVAKDTLLVDLEFVRQGGTAEVWVDGGAKTSSTTSFPVQDAPQTWKNIRIEDVPADGQKHTLHVKFSSGCATQDIDIPVNAPATPTMVIGAPTTSSDADCQDSTYTLVVPVTYAYQLGKMYAWIDTDTKRHQVSVNEQEDGAAVDYAAGQSSRTTNIKFTGLTGDGNSHTIHVACDGEGACDKSKPFDAPFRPVIDSVVVRCSQPAFGEVYYNDTVKVYYKNATKSGGADLTIQSTTPLGDEVSVRKKTTAVSGNGVLVHTFTGIRATDGASYRIEAFFDDRNTCKPYADFVTPDTRHIEFTVKPSIVDCNGNDTIIFTVNAADLSGNLVITDGTNELYNKPAPASYPFTGKIDDALQAAGTNLNLQAYFTSDLTFLSGAQHYIAPDAPTLSLGRKPGHVVSCDGNVTMQLVVEYAHQTGSLEVRDNSNALIAEIANSALPASPFTIDWTYAADGEARTATAFFSNRPTCVDTEDADALSVPYRTFTHHLSTPDCDGYYYDTIRFAWKDAAGEFVVDSAGTNLCPSTAANGTFDRVLRGHVTDAERDLYAMSFSGQLGCEPTIVRSSVPASSVLTGFKYDTAYAEGCDATTYTLKVSWDYALAEDDLIIEDAASGIIWQDAATDKSATIKDLPLDLTSLGKSHTLYAYFRDRAADCKHEVSISYNEPDRPAVNIENEISFSGQSCKGETVELTFKLTYTQQNGTVEAWIDGMEPVTVGSAQNETWTPATEQFKLADVPADGRTTDLHVRINGASGCTADKSDIVIPQQPIIRTITTDQPKAFVSCGEAYDVTVSVTFEHGNGKYICVKYTDDGKDDNVAQTTEAVTDGTTAVITLTGLKDVGTDSRNISVYFKDYESCADASATYNLPALNSITALTAVPSASTCGTLNYSVSGSVTFNNADGDLIVKYGDKVATITNQTATSADYIINDMTAEGTGLQLTAYFFNAPGCSLSKQFDAPVVPTLSADISSVNEEFICGDKYYDVTLSISAENQSGDYVVIDRVAGGSEWQYTNQTKFTINRPANAETHTIIVRYPDTKCEYVIPTPVEVTPDIKPLPIISLMPIERRVCNSERELALPFRIDAGDIEEATLTLSGATAVDNAELTINASKDTLTYILPDGFKLNAGKHSAIVEAVDAMGCSTKAELSLVEVALDGIIYSKWNDVLLVDNSAGLYSGYQWYENDKPVGDNSQVLYRTDGMTNNSYYCLLTLQDGGQIYTCEYVFQHITPSVEEQQPGNSTTANRILVRPNRVVQGGAVTVQQSEPETLHLVLMSSTGQRIAEYTQTDSSKPVNMPTVQGVYLLRITSDSGLQTEKIVVY